MKRLLLLLSILTVFCGCKKHPYSPCGCIPEPEAGLNATVYPGLFFGQTREQIVAAGIFDSIPYLSASVDTLFGGLPAQVFVNFDINGILIEVVIVPPYDMTRDRIPVYERKWKEWITQIYGAGCFQRSETDHGWSGKGYWVWDVCGDKQYTELLEGGGLIRNRWHPTR